ncbi:DUF1902 domain-containing protein [Klebsiella michiganensis]
MKTLRCMAYRQDGVFVAVCLDLSLAAQADTLMDAKASLESQIEDYIAEAVREPQYAKDLLSRRAPIKLWAKYYLIHIRMMFSRKSGPAAVFTEACNSTA